jgi:Protein of unknown function (DUF3602)
LPVQALSSRCINTVSTSFVNYVNSLLEFNYNINISITIQPSFISTQKQQNTMSPSSSFKVVEPHPQAATAYIHTSRGGAGNIVKASPVTSGADATGPASRHPSLGNKKRSKFISGRGGAGNLHSSSERAIFSFDEELEQQMRQMQDLAPVCHVGRGGAGNKVYIDGSVRPGPESDNDSTRSTDSTESGADTFQRRVNRVWGKMVGLGDYMIG